MDEVWAHHVLGGHAACLSLPVTTSCFQHLLCLSCFLFTVSVCVPTLMFFFAITSSTHPSTHSRLSLSSLFCAFSLFPCLRLVFFPCQRLSKHSRVCASGLVTRRSWETGSSRRSTAASSFAGRVRHSPDISLRLRCLFLYSEFDPVPFRKGLPRESGDGRGTKWDAWFSGYEQESGVRHKAKKGSSTQEGKVLKHRIAKGEK